jgi:hypothetical protein
MKNTLKVILAASLVAIAVAACTKPAENADTNGKDSITTTTPDTTATSADTVQVPADTTATKQ